MKSGCHGLLIDEIVARLIQSQSSSQPIRAVLIAGHTDKVGDDDYNFGLGRRRATAVLNRLCARLREKRPGLARQIKFQLMTCGERQLRATPQLSRRAEVFLPAPPRPKGCPPFKERIRLHLRILVWPTLSIPTMLRSMRQLYEPAGFLIEVVTCEVLTLPALETLSIDCPNPRLRCHVMPCANTNLHPEHIQLFRNGNNVKTNEVAVYFVRATDPGAFGIARTAWPGCRLRCNTMDIGARTGHVLGLSHLTTEPCGDPAFVPTRLMTDCRTARLQGIPTLVPAEVATMTNSALTLSC